MIDYSIALSFDYTYLMTIPIIIYEDDNNLNGTIPPELFELSGLIKLNFVKNILHGTLSSNIGKIVSFRSIKY